ncbi:MAG: hypothetical protein EOP32_00405 [Rhodococcus sp. (in: high G+C Gram-positive bacteria)]|nr:MAG: hypothetical protein EOP32_00405 [Rhodococcus sp. (in: high G+C Gram-positive bacteria)]
MPAPEFDWIEYDLTSATAGLRMPPIAGAVAAPTLSIQLPDLGAWPSPIEKARILLETAAEVEHALMVQYLYAAYSLKSAGEVTDAAQKKVLKDTSAESWPQVLRSVAREEMGHLMTVQNLLLLLGLDPNFEREDFPPRKQLYPFPLHLEALSRKSLAKYVVAEAPSDAADIGDIVEVATESAGETINRVGILYGLLGLVFSRVDDVAAGVSGHAEWDEIIRTLSIAAYQQTPPDTWHLGDDAFQQGTETRQADPDDWNAGQLRVHQTGDRTAAIQAIRDIGEQGEGPGRGDESSHFERFRKMFRGHEGEPGFPPPGSWQPTRAVPTDPKVTDVADPRTRGWMELADIRYALLLGFLEHYLVAADDDRPMLTAWIYAEMRSRIAYIARELTTMPLDDGAGRAVAGIAFTLPPELHLPQDDAQRWRLHHARTAAAIAVTEHLRDPADRRDGFLADVLTSDRARLALIAARAFTTGFARDIRPLFRQKDLDHMNFRLDLRNLEDVRENARLIVDRVSDHGGPVMPPMPDQRWTPGQVQLLERWIAEGCPP